MEYNERDLRVKQLLESARYGLGVEVGFFDETGWHTQRAVAPMRQVSAITGEVLQPRRLKRWWQIWKIR